MSIAKIFTMVRFVFIIYSSQRWSTQVVHHHWRKHENFFCMILILLKQRNTVLWGWQKNVAKTNRQFCNRNYTTTKNKGNEKMYHHQGKKIHLISYVFVMYSIVAMIMPLNLGLCFHISILQFHLADVLTYD